MIIKVIAFLGPGVQKQPVQEVYLTQTSPQSVNMLALIITILLLPVCALAMSLRVSAPHLFVDFDGIASSPNLTVALGSIAKDSTAVVAGEDPWDAFMAGYSSLVLAPLAGGNVIRLLPPLIATEAELAESVDILRRVFAAKAV
jgi:hypothetical protein